MRQPNLYNDCKESNCRREKLKTLLFFTEKIVSNGQMLSERNL